MQKFAHTLSINRKQCQQEGASDRLKEWQQLAHAKSSKKCEKGRLHVLETFKCTYQQQAQESQQQAWRRMSNRKITLPYVPAAGAGESAAGVGI